MCFGNCIKGEVLLRVSLAARLSGHSLLRSFICGDMIDGFLLLSWPWTMCPSFSS